MSGSYGEIYDAGVELRIGDRTLGTATGPTKKNAELLAAQTALAKLLSEEDGNPEAQLPQ